MKCSTCDGEHDLLDPAFRRPDVVANMADGEREARVKESSDLCAIWGRDPDEPHRYFVRSLLWVGLLDADDQTAWGLWVEIGEDDFHRVVERWSDADQAEEPPIRAVIANHIPNYPETIGLPATLRLTGADSRPAVTLDADSIHPFAVECRSGVCIHRVLDWLGSM